MNSSPRPLDPNEEPPLFTPPGFFGGLHAWIPEGEVWGDFRIVRRLGGGQFGEVYVAVDLRSRQTVALKLLLDRSATAEPLEAVALAKARSYVAPDVYDHGIVAGCPYVAMEFLGWPTLAERAARGPLSKRSAGKIAFAIAERVALLHEAGHAHGDISPNNVLVSDRDEVRLVDFGWSRSYREPASGARPPSFAALCAHDVLRTGCSTVFAMAGAEPARAYLECVERRETAAPVLEGVLDPSLAELLEAAGRWNVSERIGAAALARGLQTWRDTRFVHLLALIPAALLALGPLALVAAWGSKLEPWALVFFLAMAALLQGFALLIASISSSALRRVLAGGRTPSLLRAPDAGPLGLLENAGERVLQRIGTVATPTLFVSFGVLIRDWLLSPPLIAFGVFVAGSSFMRDRSAGEPSAGASPHCERWTGLVSLALPITLIGLGTAALTGLFHSAGGYPYLIFGLAMLAGRWMKEAHGLTDGTPLELEAQRDAWSKTPTDWPERYRNPRSLWSYAESQGYSAWDELYARQVVIVFRPRDATTEMESAAPEPPTGDRYGGLPALYQVYERTGGCYAVYEQVSGQSLAEHLAGVDWLDEHWSLQIAARVADALLAAFATRDVRITPASIAPSTIWITSDRRVVFYGLGPRLAAVSGTSLETDAHAAVTPVFLDLLLRLFHRVPEHARIHSRRLVQLALSVGPCIAIQLHRSLRAPDHRRASLSWWRARLSVVHAMPTVRTWSFTPFATLVLCASAGAISAGVAGTLAGVAFFPVLLAAYMIVWPECAAGVRRGCDFSRLTQPMLEPPESNGTD